MLEKIELNHNQSIPTKCIIIMPIYNRRHFLKQAFRSLCEQTFTHWKLVVVDDGSNDDPLFELKRLAEKIPQQVTYVKQSNGGPGSARATGQQFVQEQEFVAFFDSDDYWLPNYLKTLIDQLERVPEMDWIYCPCRRVDLESGETIHESTFLDEVSNKPLGFQKLDHVQHGDTCLIKDNNELALAQLKEPIHAGFQNSVMRARLVSDIEIPDYRIGEDRYFLMAAIIKGHGIGYVNRVHVIYNVHANNLSDTNQKKTDIDKAISVQNELCRCLTGIKNLTGDPEILAEVNRQVANIRFWIVAYNYYWKNGFVAKALWTMLIVLTEQPKNPRFIKTFLLSVIKSPIQRMAFCRRSPLHNG